MKREPRITVTRHPDGKAKDVLDKLLGPTPPRDAVTQAEAGIHSTPPTHTAFTPVLRDGKFVRWLEIGAARKGEQDRFDIRVDRAPANPDDFTGYILCAPIGTTLDPLENDEIPW